MMKGYLRFFQFVLLIFFANNATSQYADFVRPQKAVKGYQHHILLTNYQDFTYFKNHLSEFLSCEKLRIDGTVDVGLLSEVANKLDELEELQLRNFQGILSDVDLEFLEWIPCVYVYVPQNREDAILQNNYWKKFQTISLEFESVPEDFEFLSGWKKCRDLQLIAPWKKNEVNEALTEIAKWLPNLQKLTISLDVIRDLPKSVRLFSKLKKLTIIDAASLKIGIPIEDLSELLIPVKIGDKDVNIGFGVNQTSIKKSVTMPLIYLTQSNDFLAHELKYIKSIYPDGEKIEDYEWIEPEIKLDFVENIGFNWKKSIPGFPKNISTPSIEDFEDGFFEFNGHTKSDHVFLGEEKWMLSIPKNSLLNENKSEYQGEFSVKVKILTTAEQLLAVAPNLIAEQYGQSSPLRASVVVDVQLYAGKKLLDLKPGYYMQFAFVGNKIDSAQFFALKNGKFVNFYEYDYNFSDEKLQNIPFYEFYHGSKTAKIIGSVDQTLLDEKFELEGYQFLLKPKEDKTYLVDFQGSLIRKVVKLNNEKGVVLRKGSNLIGLKHFINERKIEKGIFELQVYDKEKQLFPELVAFKNYPIAFNTSFSNKDVNLLFFKAYKFHDIRFREFGGHWVLELKSNEGIWQIQLLEPKDRYKSTPSKAKSEQLKFLKKMLQYQQLRNQKNQRLYLHQNQKSTLEIQQTVDKIFGPTSVGKNKQKGVFLLRSTGRFAWANPDSLNDNSQLQIIPCEMGKIPLKVSHFQIIGNQGLTSLVFLPQERYSIPLDLQFVQYLVCKDVMGKTYVLTGEKFRKLAIEKNTLTYVDFELLPEQHWTQESLWNYLNKRKK